MCCALCAVWCVVCCAVRCGAVLCCAVLGSVLCCVLCSLLCALCSVLCGLCSVLCSLCSVLYALSSVLCKKEWANAVRSQAIRSNPIRSKLSTGLLYGPLKYTRTEGVLRVHSRGRPRYRQRSEGSVPHNYHTTTHPHMRPVSLCKTHPKCRRCHVLTR